MLEQIGIYLVLVLFFILNTVFLLFKRKTIEIIIVQLILMLGSICIGVVYVLPIDSIIAIIFILYSIVSFIGNILMMEA
jgi:hypothetical protein